jgi:hypothetical protein
VVARAESSLEEVGAERQSDHAELVERHAGVAARNLVSK